METEKSRWVGLLCSNVHECLVPNVFVCIHHCVTFEEDYGWGQRDYRGNIRRQIKKNLSHHSNKPFTVTRHLIEWRCFVSWLSWWDFLYHAGQYSIMMKKNDYHAFVVLTFLRSWLAVDGCKILFNISNIRPSFFYIMQLDLSTNWNQTGYQEGLQTLVFYKT